MSYLDDFINQNRGEHGIFHKPLVNDLLKFGREKALEAKVKRIYWKALRAGKITLCDRIEVKYRQFIPKCDLAQAFAYSLITQQGLKDK